MAILTAQHLTTYRYRRAVAFGEHHLMVLPQAWTDQTVLDHSLTIHPEPAGITRRRDAHGNWITTTAFDRPAMELHFESILTVEKLATAGSSAYATALSGAKLSRREAADLRPYTARDSTPASDPVRAWAGAAATFPGRTSPLDQMTALNAAIRSGVRYLRRTDKGTQAAAETLRLGSGSCRDLATLMIDGARALGYPARFVSGYIRVSATSRSSIGGGSTHAWLQVFLPELGWTDFDPTNGIVGTDDLVRVAITPHAGLAVPLAGTWTGDLADYIGMTVTVTVVSDLTANRRPFISSSPTMVPCTAS